MDASAFLELQEAWLHADQLGSPAFSFGAPHEFTIEEPYSFQTPDMGIDGLDAYVLDAFARGTEENLKGMSNTEEDMLMMESPLLDYLNEMLMDEVMEDRTLVSQDCIAYQSILNSLYNVISEHSTPVQSSSSSENVDINDVLSNPSVSMPASCNNDGLFNHDNADVSFTSTHIYDNPGKPSTPSFSNGHLSGMSLAPTSSPDSRRVENGYGSMEHTLGDKLAMDMTQFSKSNPATPIPTAQVEFSNRHVSFVKDRDLDVEGDYERLYLCKNQMQIPGGVVDGQSNGRADEKQHNGHAKNKKGSSRNGRGGVKGKKGNPEGVPKELIDLSNRKLEMGVALDLKELLVSCAQAVAVGNAMRAFETLEQLRANGASANGSGMHRVIHYFCEALEARIQGAGNSAYSDAAYNNRPSVAKLLKAFKTGFHFIPVFKISHYFANQSILKAAEGATRLHIVDYGNYYGLQWPCLINALADRKGGPPKLVITGIEFPQPGTNPAEGLEDIGNRLSEYAKTYNVPFEYHAIVASNWEDVNPISHNTDNGQEVLVVNCMHRLRHVLDECVAASHDNSTSCPRQKLLENICKLNPDLFVVAVVNATHNSPFFVSRFREALNYYCSKFDMVETTWDSSSDRMILERDCFYRDILNVVACEGFERVERPESYKQWQVRIRRAGFEHIPMMPSVLAKAKAHVQSYYHKDFNIDHDSNNWMLKSWKGRTFEAISAWRPSGMRAHHYGKSN